MQRGLDDKLVVIYHHDMGIIRFDWDGIEAYVTIPHHMLDYENKLKTMFADIVAKKSLRATGITWRISHIEIRISSHDIHEIKARCDWADRHIRSEWSLSACGMPCATDRIEQTKINFRWSHMDNFVMFITSPDVPSGIFPLLLDNYENWV